MRGAALNLRPPPYSLVVEGKHGDPPRCRSTSFIAKDVIYLCANQDNLVTGITSILESFGYRPLRFKGDILSS